MGAEAAGRHRRATPVRAYAALGLLVAALAAGAAGAAVRGTALVDPAGGADAGSSASRPAPTAVDPSPSGTATPVTATPARPTAPVPTRSRSWTEVVEDEVVALVNRERQTRGCGAVRVDDRLRQAAGAHSADMAAHERMSHTGSDGSSPWDRARRAGYAYAMSENVAYGYRTAAEVMRGWMNSPGHRANILDCEARAVGVGLAHSRTGTPYWTQMFGSR